VKQICSLFLELRHYICRRLSQVDMVKTRLQTQPEKYRDGPLNALGKILEEEGAGALAQVQL